MSTISIEQPPEEMSDVQREYFERMIRNINIAFNNVHQLPIFYTMPSKLSIGKVYYFGAAIASTAITAEGFWGYKSTGWVQLG